MSIHFQWCHLLITFILEITAFPFTFLHSMFTKKGFLLATIQPLLHRAVQDELYLLHDIFSSHLKRDSHFNLSVTHCAGNEGNFSTDLGRHRKLLWLSCLIRKFEFRLTATPKRAWIVSSSSSSSLTCYWFNNNLTQHDSKVVLNIWNDEVERLPLVSGSQHDFKRIQ